MKIAQLKAEVCDHYEFVKFGDILRVDYISGASVYVTDKMYVQRSLPLSAVYIVDVSDHFLPSYWSAK
jgi:hypothetical protein